MTVHRPHPIDGPWPYIVADDTAVAIDEPPALIDRRPTEDSKIWSDPDDAILYDGCDRCAEQAANLHHIDAERLGRLWTKMVEVETGSDDVDHYPTVTEAAACRTLYLFAIILDRTHPDLNVWGWPMTVQVGTVDVPLDGSAFLSNSPVGR